MQQSIMVGLLVLVLSACDSSNSSSSSDNDADTSSIPAELKGTWEVPCTEDGGQSERIQLLITDNGLDSFTEIWNNATCSGLRDAQIVQNVELFVGEAFTADSGVTVRELDITGTQTEDNGTPVNIDGFGLYYIANGNQLYFGDSETGDGDTPDTRPTDVDYSDFFIKVE